MITKLHNAIGIGSLVLLSGFTATVTALALSPKPEAEPQSSVVTVTEPAPVEQPAPVEAVTAPEPVQAPEPIQTAPTPSPKPAEPVALTGEALHRSWVTQAGITAPFEYVDAVVSPSGWDVNYHFNGNQGFCAHIISNMVRVTAEPISQLHQCQNFVKAVWGTWDVGAEVVKNRGQR